MSKLGQSAVILAAIVAVCFAVLQLGGRALFWQLPHLETAVNAMLAPRGIAIEGMEGRWRGLNPGLFAERIRFPDGEAAGFDFELDLIESLGRNRIVARRMTVADGHMTIHKGASGWRLPEAGDGGFDVPALLLHSDQIWGHFRFIARDGTRAAALHVEAMLINQDGQHRFHIGLRSHAQCADCALVVEGDIAADGPGAVRIDAQGFFLDQQFEEILGISRFAALGAATSSLPGIGRLQLALAGDWHRDVRGETQARLELALAATRMPGAPARLTAAFTAWNENGGYRGRIDALSLASGGHVANMAKGGFQLAGLDQRRRDEMHADLWLAEFSLADVLPPVAATFGGEHPAGRWLAGLAPGGDIRELVIRFDAQGLAFHGHGTGGRLAGYKGVPEVADISFAASGHRRAWRLDFVGRNFTFAFPEFFAARGPYQRGGGSLTFALASDGYLGLRGDRLWLVKDGSRIDGGIGLSRPGDPFEAHVVVAGQVDRIDVAAARDYLPLTLAPNLRRWLLHSVQDGTLRAARLLYHGHIKTRSDLPMRRVEMTAAVSSGTVDYHADWPAASAIDGVLEITGSETRIRGSARAFDIDLSDSVVRVPHRGGRARVELRGETTVERLIAFAWETPAHEAMPFLSETWTGTGRVDFAVELTVPLQGQDLRPGDMRLDFRLQDVSIDLVDLGLHFDAMDKSVQFEFPARLASEALQATLFEAPVHIAIDSNEEAVRFSLTGSASAADAYRLLGIDDLGIAAGRFGFDAVLSVFPTSERAMEMHLESDLVGLEVTLPPPLAKDSEVARTLQASLQFLDDHVAASTRYGETRGWLHVGDEGIRAGAVGIGKREPMIDATAGRVVLGGGIGEIDSATLATLLADADDGGDPQPARELPLAWELRQFRIGRLALGSLELADVVLDGYSDDGEIDFDIQSRQLEGTVSRTGTAPWRIKLRELRLPAALTNGDPLASELLDHLIAADVRLDRVHLGDEDYGAWTFGLRPASDGVALTDIAADVKGLHIESTGPVFWSKDGETSFEGKVSAGNLFEVLPQWNFAPSIESQSFASAGTLRWPGSPLNFDLARISGAAALELVAGRFLEVEQGAGAARILSLVNFSTVVQRMSLNFSDVFGEGVSFERVLAELAVADGLARFAKPAEIVGTGSSFLITGSVDLDSGALDNEMIVTLPLHNSLPWYAAFLALTNPASAAGVLVGRQVFKDQLKRLSSGKYRVRGTYHEPEVAFVGIFDNDITNVPPAIVRDGQDAPAQNTAPILDAGKENQ